jgi:predicted RNA-binding Zn-ribbon protein involved in translation (DUF1610 family)
MKSVKAYFDSEDKAKAMWYRKPVVPRKKLDRAKIMAALDRACPKCGYVITPAEIQRLDSETMLCPMCGKEFHSGTNF